MVQFVFPKPVYIYITFLMFTFFSFLILGFFAAINARNRNRQRKCDNSMF